MGKEISDRTAWRDVIDNSDSSCGTVTSATDDGRYTIDWTLDSGRAFSCIVVPETGDFVRYCETGDRRYILDILRRDSGAAITLGGPNNDEMTMNSKRFRIVSESSVDVVARDDIAFSSCAGAIRVAAQNLFESIADTIVKITRHHVLKASQISADADQVCRIHGKHQLLTADKDIRIDGDRITMG